MNLGCPLRSLSASLAHAEYVGMPDIHYFDRDWDRYRKTKEDCRIEKTRRPNANDLEVVAMFPQTWSNTALGFGGLAGQAFTPAYTTVIRCESEYAVYFAGRFAYRIHGLTPALAEDITAQRMVAVKDSAKYSS